VAFAERILTHASDLRVQASLDDKQPLQQLFLPEVVTFDGNRFNQTSGSRSKVAAEPSRGPLLVCSTVRCTCSCAVPTIGFTAIN
jgi:hypothetical protein